jgi:hypothetical protein
MLFVLRLGVIVAAVALLGACGGGTKADPPAAGPVTKSAQLTLALTDSAGTPLAAARLTQGEAYVVVATAAVVTRSQSGAQTGSEPLREAIVAFEASPGMASRVPASGDVLTDAQGTARLRFVAGASLGAHTLRATVGAAGAGSATTTLNYAITTIFRSQIAVRLRDQHGTAVTELAAGQSYQAEATLSTIEVDAKRAIQTTLPIANQLVTFSTDGGVFDPTRGEALTDAEGVARLVFVPNVVRGPYVMTGRVEIEGETGTGLVAYSVHVPDIRLGAGEPFVAGVIDADPAAIDAAGRTVLRARIVDEAGEPYLPSVPVEFRSGCADSENATISSPVLSMEGEVAATYVAGPGCVGTDRVTASVTVPGLATPRTASGEVRIAQPIPGAIEFLEAAPALIAIRGRGSVALPETTQVSFRVRNVSGVPVRGQFVTFALTTAVGGIALLNTSATTDAEGIAVAQVRSGTAATVARVVAGLPNGITTQSGQIVVSTGTPDQDSVSLSAAALNPEAWGIDGVAVSITARMADINQNPVPSVQVLFTAEGGAIDAACETDETGACSVLWRSSNPRPGDGRVTILARAAGDESFVDHNGDGVFSAGDSFVDLPEAWRDDNENGRYDAGEFFADINSDGLYSASNGRYDGLLCTHGTLCGRSGGVDVRDSLVIVMATSHMRATFWPSTIVLDDETPQRWGAVYISDMNGNLPPVGTTIELASSNGTLTSAAGDGEAGLTVGNSNARGPLTVPFLIARDEEPSTGAVTVKITAPSGQVSIGQVVVQD